jgi:DNA mismatch endonuclease (patch repair protein)
MERHLREKLESGQFQGGTPGNSRRMKAIRDRGNKSTENRFRAMLVRAGLRGWKLRPAGMVGKPDFLFPAHRVVVFIDGCFWHGCSRCGHVPGVNRPYWKAKIERNQERDKQKTLLLEGQGYCVVRFWEHELADRASDCVDRLTRILSEWKQRAFVEGGSKRRREGRVAAVQFGGAHECSPVRRQDGEPFPDPTSLLRKALECDPTWSSGETFVGRC